MTTARDRLMPQIRDQIGYRLDAPNRVPLELRHLIPDDRARVAKILDWPAVGKTVDVGCSDGAITRRLRAKYGVPVFGLDIVKHPAYLAKEPFIEWDIRQGVIPGHPFQTIYCTEMLEHLTYAEAKQAFRHLVESLGPQGYLYLTVPNHDPNPDYQAGCRDRWRWPDHRSWWVLHRVRTLDQPWGSGHFEFEALYPPEQIAEGIWLLARYRQ